VFWSVVGERRKALLKKITAKMPVEDSYLAGGTALALQLGHRESHDFDWFTAREFDPEKVAEKLSCVGEITVSEMARGSLHCFLDKARVTWLFYPNPLLEPLLEVEEMPGLSLASLPDIGLMKWSAISSRGARRDFIDLYYICREGYRLTDLYNLLPRKFPHAEINYYHLVKSLSYFADAEKDATPRMHASMSWQAVKEFFLQEQKKIYLLL